MAATTFRDALFPKNTASARSTCAHAQWPGHETLLSVQVFYDTGNSRCMKGCQCCRDLKHSLMHIIKDN